MSENEEKNEARNEEKQDHLEHDVMSLLKKLQQQVSFLEKKIDTLILQSQPKPFAEKSFSRPPRPFGSPQRSFGRDRDSSSGERGYRPERSFEKRRDEGGRSEERHGQGRDFKKHYGAEKPGFDQKKPFYFAKRKTRG